MVVNPRFLRGPNGQRGRRGPKWIKMRVAPELVVDDVADSYVREPVNANPVDTVVNRIRRTRRRTCHHNCQGRYRYS